jgi:hypothetical protein
VSTKKRQKKKHEKRDTKNDAVIRGGFCVCGLMYLKTSDGKCFMCGQAVYRGV